MSGPPGSISGQIYFPADTAPQRLAVYAVQAVLGGTFDVRYVMSEVDVPAKTYRLTVPPGQYQVVARMDSDPLSAAGYLPCNSYSCSPVMTRAGDISCHSLDCQPTLDYVTVAPGASVTDVDVGTWGSPYALDLLWSVDEFGAPGPLTYLSPTPGVTPSAAPELPFRSLPAPSGEALPAAFAITSIYYPSRVLATVHVPGGWSAVAEPARGVREWVRLDFSDRAVGSPLALGGDGLWLTAEETDRPSCTWLHPPDATAQAQFGQATIYFQDPHSAVGVQPFSGYSVTALKRSSSCIVLRFTIPSEQAREADLPTLLAIVQASA